MIILMLYCQLAFYFYLDTNRFKHCIFGAVTLPWNYTSPTNQPSCQVINDVAIEIGHHKHIKLVWILYKLWTTEQSVIHTEIIPRATQKDRNGTCMQQLSMMMFSYLILG